MDPSLRKLFNDHNVGKIVTFFEEQGETPTAADIAGLQRADLIEWFGTFHGPLLYNRCQRFSAAFKQKRANPAPIKATPSQKSTLHSSFASLNINDTSAKQHQAPAQAKQHQAPAQVKQHQAPAQTKQHQAPAQAKQHQAPAQAKPKPTVDSFFTAVEHNDLKSVAEMIKLVPDLAVQQSHGDFPLMLSTSVAMINLLCKSGADVNAKDEGSSTPIFYVTDASLVRALIRNGADTTVVNRRGHTVLTTAISELNLSMVKCLVAANVDTKVVTKKYGTAFEYATRHFPRCVPFIEAQQLTPSTARRTPTPKVIQPAPRNTRTPTVIPPRPKQNSIPKVIPQQPTSITARNTLTPTPATQQKRPEDVRREGALKFLAGITKNNIVTSQNNIVTPQNNIVTPLSGGSYGDMNGTKIIVENLAEGSSRLEVKRMFRGMKHPVRAAVVDQQTRTATATFTSSQSAAAVLRMGTYEFKGRQVRFRREGQPFVQTAPAPEKTKAARVVVTTTSVPPARAPATGFVAAKSHPANSIGFRANPTSSKSGGFAAKTGGFAAKTGGFAAKTGGFTTNTTAKTGGFTTNTTAKTGFTTNAGFTKPKPQFAAASGGSKNNGFTYHSSGARQGFTSNMGGYNRKQVSGNNRSGAPSSSSSGGSNKIGGKSKCNEFFSTGSCARGSGCKFSHGANAKTTGQGVDEGVCLDFRRGLCTRGEICRFTHGKDGINKEFAEAVGLPFSSTNPDDRSSNRASERSGARRGGSGGSSGGFYGHGNRGQSGSSGFSSGRGSSYSGFGGGRGGGFSTGSRSGGFMSTSTGRRGPRGAQTQGPRNTAPATNSGPSTGFRSTGRRGPRNA